MKTELKLWTFIGAAALALAFLGARFPDFLIVTFAAFGFAVFCGVCWAAWQLRKAWKQGVL